MVPESAFKTPAPALAIVSLRRAPVPRDVPLPTEPYPLLGPYTHALTFAGLMLASLVTCFIGVFTGAAGGIVLLGLMATVMPPLALIPVHTVVMLGSGVTRTMIMWRHVMRPAVLPFMIGALIGAAAGAKVGRASCRERV